MHQKTATGDQDVVSPPLETVFFNGDNGRAPAASAAEDGAAIAPSERDRRGRFAKGNKGGPGNLSARRSAALRQAALDGVTPQSVRDILSALVVRAITGDVAAAKVVLAHAIGKPAAAPDCDEIDPERSQNC
jgi:hypothetical protein